MFGIVINILALPFSYGFSFPAIPIKNDNEWLSKVLIKWAAGIYLAFITDPNNIYKFQSWQESPFRISIKKNIYIFDFSKTDNYLALKFLPHLAMWWDWNRSLKLHVTCYLSYVNKAVANSQSLRPYLCSLPHYVR